MPQTSSFSVGLSLTERLEQLKQQVTTFREHLSSIIRDASDDGEELGILRGQQQLREQIEEEAGAAPRADLMPHATDASIQADDPDMFVWDGTREVPKSVTKVRIKDGMPSIGYSAFYGCTRLRSITIPSRFRGQDQERRIGIPAGCAITYN